MKVKFPQDSHTTWHKSSTEIKSLFTYKKGEIIDVLINKICSFLSWIHSRLKVWRCSWTAVPPRRLRWSNNPRGWWFETGSALVPVAVSLVKIGYPQCFASMLGGDQKIVSVIFPQGSCGGTCSLPRVMQMNTGLNVNIKVPWKSINSSHHHH